MRVGLTAVIIFVIQNFFLLYVISFSLINFLQLVVSAFSLLDYIRKMRYSDYKKYASSTNMIPISVLVPAYNESKTIAESIKSLLALNYPVFEVVVINDGSKDDTLEGVINAFHLKEINQPVRKVIKTKAIRGIYRNLDIPNLVVVDKENGGKADALNAGINVSRYPIFASIDADSFLEGDSLVRVIKPFLENSHTIGVGGIVRIANGSTIVNGKIQNTGLPKSKLATFQVVEYIRAFLTGRMSLDSINSLLIISGAFGAFKKEAVLAINGYDVSTMGEDMELVMRLHEYYKRNKIKYNIKFIPDPVCWTQAPESIRDLRLQRRRWQIGLIDSLLRHVKLLANSRYGIIGLIGTPFFWCFEMIGPLVEVLGYIIIPLFYFIGYLDLRFSLLYFAISILYGVVPTIGAILLDEYTFNRNPSLAQFIKLSVYGLLENFGYRQMILLFRLEGILRFNKYKNKWGEIKRKKFNTLPSPVQSFISLE